MKLTPRSRPSAGAIGAVLLLLLLAITVVVHKTPPGTGESADSGRDTAAIAQPESGVSEVVDSVGSPPIQSLDGVPDDSAGGGAVDSAVVPVEVRPRSSRSGKKGTVPGAEAYARYSVEYRWSGGANRRRLIGGAPRVTPSNRSLKFVLEVSVSPSGSVKRLQVKAGPRDRQMRERIADVVRNWKFAPAGPAHRSSDQRCQIRLTILPRRGG